MVVTVSKFGSGPWFLAFEQSFCLFNTRKLFIRLFVTHFAKLDPDPHYKSSWIRIRIEKNSWIRIRKNDCGPTALKISTYINLYENRFLSGLNKYAALDFQHFV